METYQPEKRELKHPESKTKEKRKDGKNKETPPAPDYENFLKNKDEEIDEERGKVRGN